MRNKQNKPKRSMATKSDVQRLETKLRKSRPFRETGGIIGKRIGNMFGVDGSSVGKWLGTGIGSIFGSGDYTITGQSPSYNVLTSATQTPQFSNGQRTNVICHREYLGDIVGTGGFSLRSYPLNPGMSKTFPWLSTIAQNYQEYRIHGLVFEFRPLITDFIASGSPGVVVMATNYNADAVNFTTKQQMENSEFATSVKPTIGLMHAVECATQETILPQRYIRSGVVQSGQDLRLYDHGNFQFATQGNPDVAVGELWVTYCVEFYKPILPATVGGAIESSHTFRTGSNSGSVLGTVTTASVGNIDVSFTTNSLSFSATPLQKYFININWFGAAVTAGDPGATVIGGILLPYVRGGTDNLCKQPPLGTSTTTMMMAMVVQYTAIINGKITVNMTNLPAVNPSCEIWISELDSTINL